MREIKSFFFKNQKSFYFFDGSIFLKGMLVGLSDLIPGISGGTVAFVCGIYTELFTNLKKINFFLLKKLFQLDFFYVDQNLNLKFLRSLILGMSVSWLVFSRVVVFFLKNKEMKAFLYSLIFILIITAIINMVKKIKKWTGSSFLFLVIGAILTFFCSKYFKGFSQEDIVITKDFSFYLFDPLLIVSGCLAIAAMILPGISGSFILLFLGQYHKVIGAIASLTQNITLNTLVVLSNLFLGMVLGVFLFSRTIHFLLEKYNKETLCFLLGLMIGSVYLIWPF